MIAPVIGNGPNLYRIEVSVALGVTLPTYARGATAAEARVAVEADLSKQVAAVAHARVRKLYPNGEVIV